MKLHHYILVFIVGMGLMGCDQDMKSEMGTNIKMNTELGMLPKLISLPKQPIKVLWQVDEEAGKDNGSLTALLLFKKADYEFVIANSPVTDGKVNDVMAVDFYEQWVPKELQSAINKETTEGGYELLDIKRRKPDLFTQAELSPFKNGSVTPLGQGYVLISLYAM
jgi:hypothetical protein